MRKLTKSIAPDWVTLSNIDLVLVCLTCLLEVLVFLLGLLLGLLLELVIVVGNKP